ncbi:hypothetical protein [Micromonospora carbonacea]|uniref:Uncharacterized protein n=1 Tax=Micromonospora carbonacea TaxID=47853 RepID=A0A7H8XPP2_9ACTN|nr:hypothetical protein [Micromonospora carbonacea]MBB5826276.1 hypothetical protein [Micromonospora carbonacea]QLD25822.1 hypothetical protein HXZ27_17710 [Micromonospora carbonacea]
MTAPFLSLAQIRNRLILTARWVLRDHRPGLDGRCPVCRTAGCPAATAARDVLRAATELRLWSTTAQPTAPDRNDPGWPLRSG